MDDNKIKDTTVQTQTQTQNKGGHTMDNKRILDSLLYDVSKQIAFNIEKRYIKLSYLDTRKPNQKSIAIKAINKLSDKDRAVIRRYKELVEELATTIGNDLKADWILNRSHQQNSTVITTPQAKPPVATVTKVIKYKDKTITIKNSIVTSITDAKGKLLTKAKVEDSWILVGREVIKK